MVSSSASASIGGHALNKSIALSSILRARNSSGKVSMPLQGGMNYINLKHVQGVPTIQEGYGFSPARLRMLDAMVDRLKNSPRTEFISSRLPEPGSMLSVYA